MNISEDSIIGELVANDYRSAAVFKNHHIDFCCKGNRTLSEVCIDKKIEPFLVINELNKALSNAGQETIDYQSWPLDLLADYIEKKHHRYVTQKTPEIIQYLEKICKVHGAAHPELFEIKLHFIEGTKELTGHIKKEELMLFPHIRKMAEAQQHQQTLNAPIFGSVKNPIQVMMNEHTVEGERFAKIAGLSNQYTVPPDACNTYRVTFALLKEFENDLHLHIHLENNILFPGAIALEQTLNT